VDHFVALKLIRPDMAANPVILARFKQELLTARQVTQRNVIRIYDLSEVDGVKFITMEFVEGCDLSRDDLGSDRNEPVICSNGHMLRVSLRGKTLSATRTRIHQRDSVGAILRHYQVTSRRTENKPTGPRKSRLEYRGREVRILRNHLRGRQARQQQHPEEPRGWRDLRNADQAEACC